MCIRIFPLKFYDLELIEAVSEIVQKRFGMPVILHTETFDLNGGRDPIRNQVNSNWILKQLLARYPGNHSKLLGLTDRDLYSPVLTHVFGEAALGGSAAVVSSHRFHNEFYGLKADPDAVRFRLMSEAVHELGHTFGLIHCQYQECVMYPSSYVEEIDLKSADFCSSCLRLITVEKTTPESHL